MLKSRHLGFFFLAVSAGAGVHFRVDRLETILGFLSIAGEPSPAYSVYLLWERLTGVVEHYMDDSWTLSEGGTKRYYKVCFTGTLSTANWQQRRRIYGVHT